MKRIFIRTKNVKRFVGLMEELQKLPPNIPKLALVYGEHGLGKTQRKLFKSSNQKGCCWNFLCSSCSVICF